MDELISQLRPRAGSSPATSRSASVLEPETRSSAHAIVRDADARPADSLVGVGDPWGSIVGADDPLGDDHECALVTEGEVALCIGTLSTGAYIYSPSSAS